MNKPLAIEVSKRLKQKFPNPRTELDFNNEMELAVAVALSAQTTDKKVNEVTKGLFQKYKTWEDFANADLTELTSAVYGVNFHKGKAERLILAAKQVLAKFDGHLPKSIAELTTIPGIARKSANVILQELWGIAEGIVVDTHITRVSNRLGLTTNTDAVKIEKDLMQQIPVENWKNYSQAAVLHGRYTCVAKNPKCAECILSDICPSSQVK